MFASREMKLDCKGHKGIFFEHEAWIYFLIQVVATYAYTVDKAQKIVHLNLAFYYKIYFNFLKYYSYTYFSCVLIYNKILMSK